MSGMYLVNDAWLRQRFAVLRAVLELSCDWAGIAYEEDTTNVALLQRLADELTMLQVQNAEQLWDERSAHLFHLYVPKAEGEDDASGTN